jgi:hypothetical protein
MDSLKDLLIDKNLDEPSDVSSLKDYFHSTFQISPTIKVSQKTIVVIVPNSKLAAEIRGRVLDITRRCQLTKQLYIKVGSS